MGDTDDYLSPLVTCIALLAVGKIASRDVATGSVSVYFLLVP